MRVSEIRVNQIRVNQGLGVLLWLWSYKRLTKPHRQAYPTGIHSKKKEIYITILLTGKPWKFQVKMVLYNTFKVQDRYLSVLISNCIVLLSQFVHLKLQKCLETSSEEVQ